MAFCPDDEQIGLELRGQLDDIPHRMPGQNMGMKLDVAFLCHRACALKDLVEASGRRAGLLSNLLDELGHVIDLFYRDHVKLGIVLLRDPQRQRQGVERVLGAVIGVQDLAEHRTPSRVIRSFSLAEAASLLRAPRMPFPALILAASDAASRMRWRSPWGSLRSR